MTLLRFVLTLPEKTAEKTLLIHGGFDGNGDGWIDTNAEALQFQRADDGVFEWVATAKVEGSTRGRLFAVIGLVGRSVRWNLEVTRFPKEEEKNGVSVYSHGGRTASLNLRLTDELEA